ncbi:methyltransferase domain-containing protein [uncultured Thiohalocapsa sp.]|uniref:class I SAM-dependent methyltransferase n=1 Tax=uncultured Thiohalocapsa sp. TaxID=768990 RepID=UPI0025FEC7AC|nr:methyltransferase domain-containing protein [uncultured Thiohalocapsa sp.]
MRPTFLNRVKRGLKPLARTLLTTNLARRSSRPLFELMFRWGMRPHASATEFVERLVNSDPNYASLRFRLSQRELGRQPDARAVALIKRAVELKYLDWPKRIRAQVRGRDVLDVGCGTGVHGIGYLVVGARSYVGVDPRIDLDRDRVKDLRSSTWTSLGWTGREIAEIFPEVRLFKGGVQDLPADARFDLVVLHNTTEHLLDLDGVLATIVEHLRPDGTLLFNHHNFYSWNGHHLAPKTVAAIDTTNPEQLNYLDWAHLDFDPPEGHYFHRGLNRMRLCELMDLTERHYDIIEWTMTESKPEQGAGRLGDEVRARHPELSDEDFLTQGVFCRAVPKGTGLARLEAAERKSILRAFPDDRAAARRAYWVLNEGMDDAERNYAPRLIERAVDFGYLSWPRKIRDLIADKDVLDVGCGTGLHAVGFATVGVRSYTGVDPRVDLGTDRARNLRKRAWERFRWTGAEIMRMMPRISLVQGGVEALPDAPAFDIAVMHNVTEHLQQLEQVLASTARRLRPGGLLVYNHHNFYCWNGHHLHPKRVDEIDLGNPEHRQMVDWGHLVFDPPEDHYIRRGLNRIRIPELERLTRKYFQIEESKRIPSKLKQGGGRLTPEIRARHPELEEYELTTQHVLVRARVRTEHEARVHEAKSPAKAGERRGAGGGA